VVIDSADGLPYVGCTLKLTRVVSLDPCAATEGVVGYG
jgi:hypothetical protein